MKKKQKRKGLSLEKRRLRGDHVALHKSLPGGDSRGGSGSGNKEQGQEEREQPQGTFGLNIRKNFFTERMIRPWQGLPREVVESPSCTSLFTAHSSTDETKVEIQFPGSSALFILLSSAQLWHKLISHYTTTVKE